MVYSLALDRVKLSVKNGWIDDLRRVYIIMTIEEIMEDMDCAKQKAVKLLQELVDFGLIEKSGRVSENPICCMSKSSF